MSAKPATTPAARLYGVGGSMLPARLQGLGVGAKQEPYGGMGSMLPARLAMIGGNPMMPARLNTFAGIPNNLADKAGMIGTAHLRTQTPQPIQSLINKDNAGVPSARVFGMRK